MYVCMVYTCMLCSNTAHIYHIYLFAYELIIRKLCLCLRLCVSVSTYSSEGIKISVVHASQEKKK